MSEDRVYDGMASFPQGSLFDVPDPNCSKCGRVMLGNGQCAWCDMTIDAPEPVRRKQTHACAGMACQVCHGAAADEANKAIKRGSKAANPEWTEAARKVLWDLCSSGSEFTTDEAMEALEELGVETHDSRALGGVVRRFINKGLMREVGMTKSRRRHGARIPVYVGASSSRQMGGTANIGES